MQQYKNLKIDEIRREIRAFNNDENVQRLEHYYHSKSLPEILGASRKELAHSSFLAWILNDKESHQLGPFPLIKFLEMLVLQNEGKWHCVNKQLFDTIIISDFEVSEVLVETEKMIQGVGRLDVYVETQISYSNQSHQLRLIIENKVGAKETKDQTSRYFKYFESIRKEGEFNFYVYLTPMSSLDLAELSEPECSCKNYIQTNYQALVDYLLEPILKRDITPKTRFIIRDYLLALSQPTFDQNAEGYKQGLIMALGTEERELLTKFWDKNQKLILAALYAISSDPEKEKDVRDSATLALSDLSGTGRDRSLLSISYNGQVEAKQIRKSDIGYSTVSILEKHNLINEEVFNWLRKDKTSSFQLLKSLEEMTETEKKYRKYRYNGDPELLYQGTNYFVARNWGVNNIEKFINKITKKFTEFEFEILE